MEQPTTQNKPLKHPVDAAKQFSWGRAIAGFISGFILAILLECAASERLHINIEYYIFYYTRAVLFVIPTFVGLLCGLAGRLKGQTPLTGMLKYTIVGALWGVVGCGFIGAMISTVMLEPIPSLTAHTPNYFPGMMIGMLCGLIAGAIAGISYSIIKRNN